MEVVEDIKPSLTAEEKEAAKLERKKANKVKIAYKKNNYNFTNKYGPRAV
jgi:hypothetical protein